MNTFYFFAGKKNVSKILEDFEELIQSISSDGGIDWIKEMVLDFIYGCPLQVYQLLPRREREKGF